MVATRYLWLLAALPLATRAPAATPEGENLVDNGGFDAGRNAQPRAWSPVDGLTVMWDNDGNPGSCVRFDPSVQQAAKKHFEEHGSLPAAPANGGQYGTVGAHEGVWLFSAPIRMRADDRYFVLSADVRANVRSTQLFYPQVLVRGYQQFDAKRAAGRSCWFQVPHPGGPAYSEQFGKEQRRAREGDCLQVYRTGLVCRIATPNRWQRFQLAFKLPKPARYRPEILLLKLYAMWPLGEYRFDNVRLERVGADEYQAVRARGHSIKGFEPP